MRSSGLRRRLLKGAAAWAVAGCAGPPPRADGHFTNPVMAGDHPDPTVLKHGRDYYMTFSSFDAVPGLLIWHSRDLVNWQPLARALRRSIGSVWAPELCRHGERFYLYVPAKHPRGNDIWVLHATDIRGPWSDPVPLGLDLIDPGHAVDEQGRRWLFMSGGTRVALSPDGLRTAGPVEKVYEGWNYPEHWDVESRSQEGPKLTRHGGWWHMTLALGGTAGPPTGHMVVSARARTLAGPWENSPYNPIVRTQSAAERWWSRGHATLVEGPTAGDWYMLYHGYENSWRTLGRQTLLEPIEWTADGWWRSRGVDVAGPIAKPREGEAVPHGLALSDDFSGPTLAPQWAFHRGDAEDAARVNVGDSVLQLRARGRGPADSPPLCFVAGDHAYQVDVDIEFDEAAQAGLLLFYSEKLYAGVGIHAGGFVLHRYGTDQRRGALPAGMQGRALRLRLTHREHVLTVRSSVDGGASWLKYGTQIETSGYHHNVAGGFLSLRPALYAAGQGSVRFRRLRYLAL